jgi:peptidoglycan glycosyltransferase
LPVALTVAVGVALGCVEEEARLQEARSLLAAGEAVAAEELLEKLAGSPISGPEARTGLVIAAALRGQAVVSTSRPTLAASRFAVDSLARGAFERGDLSAVLALAELGGAELATLRAAALIEEGRTDELGEAVPAGERGELAVRVARYLASAGEHAHRTFVRDRRGRLVGYLDADGELELALGVAPAMVPRALAEILPPYRGTGAVLLSLDLELSALAYESFGEYRGSIVLVEPASGEILAAVSDRRTFASSEGTPAFDQQREPASIMKLLTTTAYRRAGHEPDATMARKTCNGHGRYAGELLYCPYVAGPLRSLDRAMALSCNMAFADLGVAVGRRGMLEELRLYGFDTPLGPFPSGRVVERRGDDRQLADLSVGLEATEITPLHAALLAAVMANDGLMPEPTLLHATDGRLGLHLRRLPIAPGRRVIEPEWADEIVESMVAVAERGTGRATWPPSFPVAMKTGTASHPVYGFHTNYVGIGPLPEPRVAFAVRITHQGTSRNVRYASRRVTRRLLDRLGAVYRDGATTRR